jgi:uncharacterized protein YidB (DUF937 family)
MASTTSNRMLALLGLLAVAGWQNRDKLAGIFANMTGQGGDNRPETLPRGGTSTGNRLDYDQNGGRQAAPAQSQGGFGDLFGNLGGLLGGGAAAGGAGGLAGALNDLLGQFSANGHRDEAESWIKTGPNRQLGASQLEEALGEDTLRQLSQQTGLSRDELLKRLSTVLPTAVDTLTPEGRLPTREEEARWARTMRAA